MNAHTLRTGGYGLLEGLTRGCVVWFESMGRTQDLSAPWREDKAAEAHARSWRGPHPGPGESSVAMK